MKNIFFLFGVLYLLVYTHNENAFVSYFTNKTSAGNDTSYAVYKKADNSFAYKIMIGQKTLIDQTSIPGRPGSKGFKTKNDAAKVADLVLGKLKKGQMPPSINEEELKRLNIL